MNNLAGLAGLTGLQPIKLPNAHGRLGYVVRPGVTSLSYSKILTAHSCPRRARIQELETRAPREASVHTAYGHAFGAGVQELFRTDGDIELAWVAALAAWNVEVHDELPKDKKSLWTCLEAITQWAEWEYPKLAEEWELAPSGVELLFLLEITPSYDYQGHIDLVLQHRITRALAVAEVKTTNWAVSDATYANSNQTNGYQVVLHALAKKLGVSNSRKVFYIVHKPKELFERELNFGFDIILFVKSSSDNITFLHGLVLEIRKRELYLDAGLFPKHGESCQQFKSPCRFFGTCDTMLNLLEARSEKEVELEEAEDSGQFSALGKEEVDCWVTLEEVMNQLSQKIQVEDTSGLNHLEDMEFEYEA